MVTSYRKRSLNQNKILQCFTYCCNDAVMNKNSDIDTVLIVELGGVERRRLDKGKILAFSHVQNGQTIVIYGDKDNPESFIIEENTLAFLDSLNGVLQKSIFYNSINRIASEDLPLTDKLNKQSQNMRDFRERSVARMQEIQERYWFVEDHQGNYKNIRSDEIYEVSPNPNSPWALTF
jgi:hypothetical protein